MKKVCYLKFQVQSLSNFYDPASLLKYQISLNPLKKFLKVVKAHFDSLPRLKLQQWLQFSYICLPVQYIIIFIAVRDAVSNFIKITHITIIFNEDNSQIYMATIYRCLFNNIIL